MSCHSIYGVSQPVFSIYNCNGLSTTFICLFVFLQLVSNVVKY